MFRLVSAVNDDVTVKEQSALIYRLYQLARPTPRRRSPLHVPLFNRG